MPEKVMPGPVQDSACIREAVCIHTKKIFDSCRDKDIALYKCKKTGPLITEGTCFLAFPLFVFSQRVSIFFVLPSGGLACCTGTLLC